MGTSFLFHLAWGGGGQKRKNETGGAKRTKEEGRRQNFQKSPRSLFWGNLSFWLASARLLKRSPFCNHLKHGFFNTKIKGNHHLQGNVQVYNVRIPVLLQRNAPEGEGGGGSNRRLMQLFRFNH